MIQYIFNVITVGCALILPGMAVAHGFFRKTLSKWNLSFRIVSYVIISLSIIFLFAFVLGEIPLSLSIKRMVASSMILVASLLLLLMNLMTGRISLGASNLLDILNPRLDRYQPDYVLINDCRPDQSYTQFIARKNLEAYNYITQNYTLVEHNPQKHIMLFKRN